MDIINVQLNRIRRQIRFGVEGLEVQINCRELGYEFIQAIEVNRPRILDLEDDSQTGVEASAPLEIRTERRLCRHRFIGYGPPEVW